MKRMKRWLALLAALTVMAGVVLTGCGTPASTEPAPLMLWEVTDEDNNRLYLMGSIHVGTEDMYPMAQPIEDAFAASDALAVECDILAFNEDTDMQMDIAMEYGIYTDGTTVRDYLSDAVYNKAVEILKERNMYSEMYDYMRVHQWSSLVQSIAIDEAGYSSDYGIDLYLENKARETGKPVYEVESVESQMQMMDNFSIELQAWMLELNLDLDAMKTDLELTLDAWKRGDIELLCETETEGLTPEQEVLLAEYNQEMLIDRNILMAEKAEEYIESGEIVFFTVGAAHMGGETGVVQLMEDKGYTVKRINEDGSYVGEDRVVSAKAA